METTVNYFIYFHSIFRYFILLFAVIVAIQSLVGMMGKRKFLKSNRIPALFLLIFCDIQFLFGLVLYYHHIIQRGVLSSSTLMTDTYSRFYAIEHSLSMTIAIILVHIGYNVTKKPIGDDRKFKRLFWCNCRL